MIDDLSLLIAEEVILTIPCRIDLLQHALNPGIVHINQEHTHLRGLSFCNIHRTGKRHNPVIALGIIDK